MKNLGIAKVKVNLWDHLPYIARDFKKYDFDISAFNWKGICSSNLFTPIYLEQIEDNNQGFAAIHPSKRKWFINNFMAGSSTVKQFVSSGTNLPYIVWTPLPQSFVEGAFADKIPQYDQYNSAIGFIGATPPKEWTGPAWMDNEGNKIPYPDDIKTLTPTLTKYNIPSYDPTCLNSVGATSGTEIPNIKHIWQTNVRDGLWWAVRSNDFLTDNMPFWVTIAKNPNPPTSANHSTFIVIRIGKNDPDNQFDIWIGADMKPFIIDYKCPAPPAPNPPTGTPSSSGNTTGNSGTGTSTAGLFMEFEDDMSRVLSNEENLEIGIMTVAGRLVVFVNNSPFVYTRVEKNITSSPSEGGKMLECKIASGPVDIYGTNIQAKINVCPMVFSPMGIMVVPIPAEIQDPNNPTSKLVWYGAKYDGSPDPNGSVCNIPTPPTEPVQGYGCDCFSFTGDGGNASPVGPTSTMFHLQGEVSFKKAGSTNQEGLADIDFYYIAMYSSNSVMNLPSTSSGASTATICYGGCPYFFRIKGVFVVNPSTSASSIDISDYVISVSENASAGDYFHIKKSATVTIYNPSGIVSSATVGGNSILKYQKGIDISWSWGDEVPVKTFTGVITNVNSNEVAGKEILTISCEDYMYLLNNIPIINSPFYDGMVGYYAVKEIATRAGILDNAFVKEWDNQDDYFLPAGFSFSQPAKRFQPTQKLFECMIDIVKRFEAYIYFDGEGKLHIAKLPGGLFSVSLGTIPVQFYSSIVNPSITDPDTDGLILNERNIDYNFDSTVNSISIFTLDRSTKNAIIYGKGAMGATDRLTFRKPMLIDQPALGEIAVTKAWANDLSQRVFKPIIKTRFGTVGGRSTVLPLIFVTVDGQSFRLTSVKRDFSAENNDFKASYEAEWLGG